MRIPDDLVQEIRERAGLVEIIGEYVTLRRSGRGHVGLCPFHAEKTPSFTVSEDRGLFHCFGCGVGGNVFSFLMRMEGITFVEAARQLARRVGVSLPEAPAGGGGRRDTEQLYEANELAACFYEESLAGQGGAAARRYLERRGVSQGCARRFRLGYAPATGRALSDHLRRRGVAAETLVRSGLAAERGTLADRFRDRLIFPITDPLGRVTGFGGRVIDAERGPKYLNSPETPLYRKGRSVYGLPQAKEAIRSGDRVLLVEGYFDALVLAQSGIPEVVATLGTAVSVEQLRLLRRYTANVFACFDGDGAGERAALRTFPLSCEAGVWGRAVFLPAGDDPDSFVRDRGPQALHALLGDAPPLWEFFLQHVVPPRAAAPPVRAAAAREVAEVLRRVRDPFERDLFVREAAERLGVDEALLRREGVPTPASSAPTSPADISGESLLLEMMIRDPLAAERARASGVIEVFEDPDLRALAQEVAERAGGGLPLSVGEVVDRLPAALAGRLTQRVLGEEEDDSPPVAEVVEDCIRYLRRREERRRIRGVREQIAEAERRGDEEEVRRGLTRLREMMVSGPVNRIGSQVEVRREEINVRKGRSHPRPPGDAG